MVENCMVIHFSSVPFIIVYRFVGWSEKRALSVGKCSIQEGNGSNQVRKLQLKCKPFISILKFKYNYDHHNLCRKSLKSLNVKTNHENQMHIYLYIFLLNYLMVHFIIIFHLSFNGITKNIFFTVIPK